MENQRPTVDGKRNFILQQGLDMPASESCPVRFSALMFQPRVVGVVVVVAVALQSPEIFLPLGALLWWNALVPAANPFDAVYNVLAGSGAARLAPAEAPRRFAQGMAGTFNLAIGILLLAGAGTAAIVLQVLLLAALAALLFGRFCLGSFIYYVLRGRSEFALRTLPWKPGASS